MQFRSRYVRFAALAVLLIAAAAVLWLLENA